MRQSMESESPSSTHGQERWALVGESGESRRLRILGRQEPDHGRFQIL